MPHAKPETAVDVTGDPEEALTHVLVYFSVKTNHLRPGSLCSVLCCVCVCVHKETRGQPQVSFLRSHPPDFKIEYLIGMWGSLTGLE